MVDEVATYSDAPWASGKETRKSTGNVMVKAKNTQTKDLCEEQLGVRIVSSVASLLRELGCEMKRVLAIDLCLSTFQVDTAFLEICTTTIVPWVCFSNTSPISPLSPSLLLLAWLCDVSTLLHSTRCLLCQWQENWQLLPFLFIIFTSFNITGSSPWPRLFG